MIFLDACAIIYWVELIEPQYTAFAKKLLTLREQYGALPFATSTLSLLECRIKPLKEHNQPLLKNYQYFFTATNIHLIDITVEILEKAAHLRAFNKLKTPDAIQAASALSISDEIIFLTDDTAFKNIKNLFVEII